MIQITQSEPVSSSARRAPFPPRALAQPSYRRLKGLLIGGLMVAAALMPAVQPAFAEGAAGFSIKAGTGSVEVTADRPWHINTEGPWKLTVGTVTLAADRWALSEQVASVSGVPAGEARVRIFLCNAEQCRVNEAVVTVR